ncbi:MAG: phosphocholine cytidylyltransferase family protein [Candidatus Latescibacterota bacterium]|nr:phosphocholine cytidylyltransferase family protein [Candidatus Latescibacterota bacterium]
MRAIILAAGAGTRLRPLTDGRPKCLVPIGGKTLLGHQLHALHAHGVSDVHLVIGFEADQIRTYCRDHSLCTIRCIENERWESTNSIHSLYMARASLEGDILLFNCDVLFHPEILSRMLDQEGSNISVDSQMPRIAGEMNAVVSKGGRIDAIAKNLDLERVQAVSVQLARFDSEGAALVRAEVERLTDEGLKEAFPTSSYTPLIARGKLVAVEVGDLPWAEIDSLEDFERAEVEVLPRLPESR